MVSNINLHPPYTAEAARQLAEVKGSLGEGCVVVSLQNGAGNGAVLREAMGHDVLCLSGMVNFNVIWDRWERPTLFRRCTLPKIGLPCLRIEDPR